MRAAQASAWLRDADYPTLFCHLALLAEKGRAFFDDNIFSSVDEESWLCFARRILCVV